jgi:hypothetical protein
MPPQLNWRFSMPSARPQWISRVTSSTMESRENLNPFGKKLKFMILCQSDPVIIMFTTI